MTPFMIIAIHYSHFNMPLFFIMLFICKIYHIIIVNFLGIHFYFIMHFT